MVAAENFNSTKNGKPSMNRRYLFLGIAVATIIVILIAFLLWRLMLSGQKGTSNTSKTSNEPKTLISKPVDSKHLHEMFSTKETRVSPKFDSSRIPFIKFIRNISRKEFKADTVNNYIFIGEVVPNYSDAASYQTALESGETINYKLALIVIYYMNTPGETGKNIRDSKSQLLPVRVSFFFETPFTKNTEIYFHEKDATESFISADENANDSFKKENIQKCLNPTFFITPRVFISDISEKSSISTRKDSQKESGLNGENCGQLATFLEIFEDKSEVSLAKTLESFADGVFVFIGYDEKGGKDGKGRLMVPASSELVKFLKVEEELNEVYKSFVKKQSPGNDVSNKD